MVHIGLRCTKCKATYPKGTLYLCPKCQGILDVEYDYDKIVLSRKALEQSLDRTVWRYRDLLPCSKEAKEVSLGEGGTPLHKASRLTAILGTNVMLKDESRNPTGSFKDRAISVAVSWAIEQGAKRLVSASSGNAAASVAAYSAKAGLDCYLLFDSKSPPTKHLQPTVYGAKGLSVKNLFTGTPQDLSELLYTLSNRLDAYNIFCCALINPYTLEGNKTIAYEICEALNWSAPDAVVVPVGGGDNLVAEWKGFKEMLGMGLIDKLPKMVGVQSTKADPLVKAWKSGSETVAPIETPSSIASGINVPYTGDHTLKAIRESKGAAVAVDDEEILLAEKEIASLEGVWVEPSSASAVAAVPKLVESGIVSKDDVVVCVLTGSGLKDTDAARKFTPTVQKVNRDLEEIMRAFKRM
ncbi:MAG: threonine synthase [Nitrososphaerales archaeon]